MRHRGHRGFKGLQNLRGWAPGFAALILALGPSDGPAADLHIPILHQWGGHADAVFHRESPNLPGLPAITITRLEYLVTDVRLQRPDSTWYSPPDTWFLVHPADGPTTLSLHLAEPGPFCAISFRVGVDAATNHADPARWPANHPMSPLRNDLYWTWAQGYIFLACEGYATPTGPHRAAFLYHLGGDDLAMVVKLPLPAGDPTHASLVFHVDRLWRGAATVDPLTQPVTHSGKGDDVAPTLARNVSDAFEVVTR